MSFAASSTAGTEDAGAFGQVMGIVAVTLGTFTLGAYWGDGLTGGASIACFIVGFLGIVGLNLVRGAPGAAVGLLIASGLFLGLGLSGAVYAYAAAAPGVVWQAAAATGLFVAALGSLGYAIRADLSGGYRVLFVLLLGLILYGFISLFVAMPGGNVVYALLGLGIFGGYVVLDFNRLRAAGTDDAASIAAGIFLDITNVFLFFLQLFGRNRD